ncbi:MAG: PilZ domain-containing protein [Myxococcota bacterium]|nr:PilZ domain-containing protein [Myxococcota bacterium]
MADKNDYLKGRIQLTNGNIARLVVIYADGRELSALVEGRPELAKKSRCAFKHEGETVELLVKVQDTRHHGEETGAALSVLSAYSRVGRKHLESFLDRACSMTQFSQDQFVENEKGCFCLLDMRELSRRRRKAQEAADEAAAAAAEKEGSDKSQKTKVPLRSDVERRWQHRVRHVLDACIERGQKNIDTIIFEVSDRGVRISVPAEDLPEIDLNGPVRLFLAFPSGRLTIRARCLCRVVWWLAPEPGEDEATLGLEVLEVLDGVHGQQWSRFIAAVSETSPVVPIGEHGQPRE